MLYSSSLALNGAMTSIKDLMLILFIDVFPRQSEACEDLLPGRKPAVAALRKGFAAPRHPKLSLCPEGTSSTTVDSSA